MLKSAFFGMLNTYKIGMAKHIRNQEKLMLDLTLKLNI